MSYVTKTEFDFIILGGGLAGLTAGRELLRSGFRVAVLEKDTVIGGLARTIERDQFRFDLGGHRFHSNNEAVVTWLKDLLKDELIRVPRQSHIYLNQRYVRYPIEFPDALFTFGVGQAISMAASYGLAQLGRGNAKDDSFEDWVVNRFGKKMYSYFFEPYTEKVWGIPCRELSADWAAQRIGLPSLTATLRQAVRPAKETPATAISEFYYPRSGFGTIVEQLAADIKNLGGTLLTETMATAITPGEKTAVTLKSGEQLCAKEIISTIPLTTLASLLANGQDCIKQAPLSYRGLLTVFLALDQAQVSSDSWTYFPDKEIFFGRIHEPKNWSAALVPKASYTSLCVEVFASPHEPTWQLSDTEVVEKTATQLTQLGLIKPNALLNGWVQRLTHAYPIYDVGYTQKLEQYHSFLSQWPTIHLAGRTGSFHYLNSDGVIENVFELLADLQHNSPHTITSLAGNEGRWV